MLSSSSWPYSARILRPSSHSTISTLKTPPTPAPLSLYHPSTMPTHMLSPWEPKSTDSSSHYFSGLCISYRQVDRACSTVSSQLLPSTASCDIHLNASVSKITLKLKSGLGSYEASPCFFFFSSSPLPRVSNTVW